MVHDLTANNDFQGGRGFNFLGIFTRELERVSDNLTPPYDEVVLTGSTFDRDCKRYILDYESDEKNMCDCCGAPIRIRLWDFEENKTLCPECEKWLEEVIDNRFAVRVVKPWDIRDFERENAVDNVLLWD